MTDIVGIFEHGAHARESLREILSAGLASRRAIELVEPAGGQQLQTAVGEASVIRTVAVLCAAALITLSLSLPTLIIDGFGFGLAAIAAFIAAYEKRGGGHILLQNKEHLEEGKTLLVVTTSEASADRVVELLRKHGGLEAAHP